MFQRWPSPSKWPLGAQLHGFILGAYRSYVRTTHLVPNGVLLLPVSLRIAIVPHSQCLPIIRAALQQAGHASTKCSATPRTMLHDEFFVADIMFSLYSVSTPWPGCRLTVNLVRLCVRHAALGTKVLQLVTSVVASPVRPLARCHTHCRSSHAAHCRRN